MVVFNAETDSPSSSSLKREQNFAVLDFLDLKPKFGCIWMAYVAPIMPFRASKEYAVVQNAGSLPFDL